MDYTAHLPAEILGHVFHLVQSVAPIPSPGPNVHRRGHPTVDWLTDYDPRAGWLIVTFVCSRWRRVAIGTATLWSEANYNLGKDWFAEFAQRSGSTPLSVTLTESLMPYPALGDGVDRDLWNVLHANQSRIRALDIDGCWDFLMRLSFDHLETLAMPLVALSPEINVQGWDSAHIFGASALTLRHLHAILYHGFANRYFRWSEITIFRRLESLDLRSDSEAFISSAPFSSLLDTLQSIPELSVLFIKKIGGGIRKLFPPVCKDSFPCRASTPRHLKSLAQLFLHDALKSLAHFLQHIRLPCSAHIIVHQNDESTFQDILKLSTVIAEAMLPSPREFSPFYAATVRCDNPDPIDSQIRAFISMTREPHLPPIFIEPPALHHPHTLQIGVATTLTVFQELPSFFDFAGIRALSLEGLGGGMSTGSAIGAATFASVEFLRVSRGKSDGHALNIFLCMNDEDTSLLFPNLRTLDLNADFKLTDLLAPLDSTEVKVKDLGTGSNDAPWTVLENIVHVRRSCGCPLRTVYAHIEKNVTTLRLRKCYKLLSDEEVDEDCRLRAAVARIEALSEVRIVRREHVVNLESE